MSSSDVLRRNNLGKVVATYVGNEPNIYVKTSLWVPKILWLTLKAPMLIEDLKEGTKLLLQAYSFGGSS
jgi:hypothetical protein